MSVQPSARHTPVDIRLYADAAAAGSALASRVAADLRSAIALRGAARLAVSGGTTPAPFLRALASEDVEWNRVHVTLTDERWVPPGHPRANATLVADCLLKDRAAACHWHPLYLPDVGFTAGVARLNADLADFGWPLDVAVLGIGADGHVASLFPGARSWQGVDLAQPLVPAVSPTGEERVSLTLATLRSSRQRYLLFSGESKLALVESLATADPELPAAALIADARDPLVAYASRGP